MSVYDLGYLIVFALLGAPFLPLLTPTGRGRWLAAYTSSEDL